MSIAKAGYNVVGVDTNPEVVQSVNECSPQFEESGLNQALELAVRSGLFIAQTEVGPSDIYLICVPTPFHDEEGALVPDMSYVMSACEAIALVVKKGDVIVLESTSPIGTTQKIYEALGLLVGKRHINVAYCPERVLPGNILSELVHNDRIFGGVNKSSSYKVA